MKKILISLMVLLILLFSVQVFAGVTAVINKASAWKSQQIMYRVLITHTQEGASALAEYALSTYLSSGAYGDLAKIVGGLFYQVETVPGTGDAAPAGTYDLGFDSDLNAAILDLSSLSATVPAVHDGKEDLGFRPVIWDLQITAGDIGAADDTIYIYIYILK